MAWTIEYQEPARQQLKKLDWRMTSRIIDFLEGRLVKSGNPRRFGQPLAGSLNRYWRYRVGDYRVLCEIEDDRIVIVVVKIGHRREVYRT